jgi:hypothetical protein
MIEGAILALVRVIIAQIFLQKGTRRREADIAVKLCFQHKVFSTY